jgi:hypothetical protein
VRKVIEEIVAQWQPSTKASRSELFFQGLKEGESKAVLTAQPNRTKQLHSWTYHPPLKASGTPLRAVTSVHRTPLSQPGDGDCVMKSCDGVQIVFPCRSAGVMQILLLPDHLYNAEAS